MTNDKEEKKEKKQETVNTDNGGLPPVDLKKIIQFNEEDESQKKKK